MARLTAKETVLKENMDKEIEVEIERVRRKEKANFERQLTDLRHEISVCRAVQNVYDEEVTMSRKPVSNSVRFRNVRDRRTKGKSSEMADGADRQGLHASSNIYSISSINKLNSNGLNTPGKDPPLTITW